MSTRYTTGWWARSSVIMGMVLAARAFHQSLGSSLGAPASAPRGSARRDTWAPRR